MKLFIGQIEAGPEIRGSAVARVLARVAGLVSSGEEDSFGSLDVVFHVHGSLLSPEHVGIRTGRFSKRERLLTLQIAVPKDVVESDEGDIRQFVLTSLDEAVVIAEPVFRRAKIAYNLQEFLSRIDKARQAFIH